ncbi:LysE family transporter [Streptomyces sp. TRM64462]|uniref:LysE family transporter n=1 Tax=Streptomyces sp. TRM64462 TaxID=2741726 RepID=UPI001586F2D7|nr:LysE family transporter [Streptomyces sp. TRM64462]
MTAALVAGLLAGYGIAVPVGAVAAYLVALTARTSLKVGVCAALGVATADGLYALVAAAGGAALVPVLQPVMVPLRWLAALVLVTLAVRSGATALKRYRSRHGASGAADGAGEGEALGPVRAYLAFLGITVMNPMTIVYFAALVLGSRALGDTSAPERSVFVAAAFVASASWQVMLAGGGALLGRTLTSGRGRLVTALTSSTLIVALAVHLLATAQ